MSQKMSSVSDVMSGKSRECIWLHYIAFIDKYCFEYEALSVEQVAHLSEGRILFLHQGNCPFCYE